MARKNSKSSDALSELNRNLDPLFTSRSSTNLARPAVKRKHANKNADDADWLLQTASALTTSIAESKGQAWLATRDSSTSLVDTSSPAETIEFRYPTPRRRTSGAEADDEFSPLTTRHHSRAMSAMASARNSRMGSRVGSRAGSRVGLMTPMGIKTPGERDEDEGYFLNVKPDFVDIDEAFDEEAEEEMDEGEMKKLVLGRLGGWVDWAVGWMDLRVDDTERWEDRREEEIAGDGLAEGGDVEGQGKNEDGKREPMEKRNRALTERGDAGNKLDVAPPAEEGGWKDAAWFLGMASKVLV